MSIDSSPGAVQNAVLLKGGIKVLISGLRAYISIVVHGSDCGSNCSSPAHAGTVSTFEAAADACQTGDNLALPASV